MFSTLISSTALAISALAFAIVVLRPKFITKRVRLNFFFRNEPELLAVMAGGLLLSLLDICARQHAMLAADMALSALPVSVLPQTAGAKERHVFSHVILTIEAVAAVVSLLCSFGLCPHALLAIRPLVVLLSASYFFAGFFRRPHFIGERRADAVSPFSVSSLFSDIFSLFVLGFSLIMSAMFCFIPSDYPIPIEPAADIISFMVASAVFTGSLLRRAGSRHFLFFEKYERMMSEAVRDSVSSRMIRADRKEDLYRGIFMRIEEYFRSESPYLDTELNIAGVSERIFTNKVYVSRAISECADTNFCQYVNRYRVGYAMDCFRKNTSLRVSDLAYMSGFRTVASYNTAFRRVVGEIPSDWMRRTAAVIRRSTAGPVMDVVGALAV